VVDVRGGGGVAVLIIPQGREREWTFTHEEGLMQIAGGTPYARVIFVACNVGHEFDSLESVQEELNGKLLSVLPDGVDAGKVPYVTFESGMGERCVVARHSTEASGEFVVEEVPISGRKGLVTRRLVFFSNPFAVQSEAVGVQRREGTEINHSELAFEYHRAAVAGLALIGDTLQSLSRESAKALRADDAGEEVMEVVLSGSGLVLGLGGGAFPMFLHRAFPWLHVTSVELDADVARLAESYFGYTVGHGNSLVIGDGVEAVHKAGPEEHVIIMVDVDSKDLSTGVSFPPAAFLSPSFLAALRTALAPGGCCLVNVACRASDAWPPILASFVEVFDHVSYIPIGEGDANRLVIAQKGGKAPSEASVVRGLAGVRATTATDLPASLEPSEWLGKLEASDGTYGHHTVGFVPFPRP
jgi:hypothetical protein